MSDNKQILEALQRLEQINREMSDRLMHLEARLAELSPQPQKEWGNKYEAAKALGIHEATLGQWRSKEWGASIQWIEGVHYRRMPVSRPTAIKQSKRSSASYEYNIPLLLHWRQHQGDMSAQTRAVNSWLKQQKRAG